MPTIGRKLVNVTQHAKGRVPHKYEFEVIPVFCGEVPEKDTDGKPVDKVLFAWERGSKLFVTNAEKVSKNTRAVFWKQYLRQTTTVYYEKGKYMSKDFGFKLQSVTSNSKGKEDRTTISKIHVDLAKFCNNEVDPEPQEVYLQLKPKGKLKVSIKACWLKNATIDADAMTEMSAPSMFTSTNCHGSGGEEAEEMDGEEAGARGEQDLSGFDNEGNPTSTSGRQHRTSKPRNGRSSSGGGGRNSEGGSGADVDHGEGDGSSDNQRKHRTNKKKGRQRASIPEEIPEGFEPPVDEETEARKERRRERRRQQRQMEEEETAEGANGEADAAVDDLVEEGRQLRGRRTLRDILCCCLQPRVAGEGPLGTPGVELQETQDLLSQRQQLEAKTKNSNKARRARTQDLSP